MNEKYLKFIIGIGVIIGGIIIFENKETITKEQITANYMTDESEATIKPVKFPIDTFQKENEYEYFKITDMGYIAIPACMELQSGDYKNNARQILKETMQDSSYQRMISIVDATTDRIVFQQKGLNQHEKEGFNTFVRIIIKTDIGNRGDYLNQLDDYSMTEDEAKELDLTVRNQIEADIDTFNLKTTMINGKYNIKTIKYEETKIVEINGYKAIMVSSIQQLNNNPLVHMDIFAFHNNDRLHKIILFYRQVESDIWKPLFNKTMNSLILSDLR